MKKMILLVIAIAITLTGTIILGVYDHNTYYDPSGKNATTIQAKYKEYITKNALEITGDLDKQTRDRISLNEVFSTQYYNNEPILDKEVTVGDKTLFNIVIYKDVARYTPDANTNELKYRYNTYIFNIDYVAIQELFLEMDVPEDDSIITNAGYPTIVINFYPNQEYNADEGIYYDQNASSNKLDLFNGESLYGSSLTSSTSFNLYDYASNPALDEDEAPYYVQFLSFNGYPSNSDNLNLFNDGAYVKVDAVVKAEVNYSLENPLVEEFVSELNFKEDINTEDYSAGFNSTADIRTVLNNVDLDGVQRYDVWIFTHYIWWQCLICFLVLGFITAGFYFALTYDFEGEDKKNKGKKKK